MFSGRTNSKRAFTLLEVMLAVLVLGLVSISIYRFVETTLFAVRVSREHLQENALVEAFAHYLRVQMQSLPVARLGAITGQAHRFNDVASDELCWISRPGSGLMTRNAEGEWNVTLTTQPVKGGTGSELGMRRRTIDGKNEAKWLPLLSGVTGFEVRYYDQRNAGWMEKWTDIAVRPSLVRVRLWRSPSPDPYEVVLPLPVAAGNGQPPNFNDARPGQLGGQPGGQSGPGFLPQGPGQPQSPEAIAPRKRR